MSTRRWRRCRRRCAGAEEQLRRAPPRNSCSAEYWRPRQRDRSNDDDDDADSRGGRAFALQRRSLFQRLRWPSDKGCGRENSPRRSHGESSRHGGRRHDRGRSLSLATRRSRERSLDRFIHHFNRREKADKVHAKRTLQAVAPIAVGQARCWICRGGLHASSR
jgi:hypothetical protein